MRMISTVTVLVLMMGCSNGHKLPLGSNLSQFSPTAWKEETLNSDSGYILISARQKMLGDVVRNILPGKSKAEIENVLGKPINTSYGGTEGELVYYLGYQRNSLFPIDSEWLMIWLDEKGKFERYALHTD